MPFDFTTIKGIDPEQAKALNDNADVQGALTTHIDTSVNMQVSVARDDFKSRMDALNDKVTTLNTQLKDAPDADEIKALREAAKSQPELQATIESLNKTKSDLEAQHAQAMGALTNERRSSAVNMAIEQYNTANPTMAVKADMAEFVRMMAADALQFDEAAGAFRVYKDGAMLATDNGAATPVDWLAKFLRAEKPSLFEQPTGGGANGSGGGGASKPYADLTESERVALHKSDPAEFQRLRESA